MDASVERIKARMSVASETLDGVQSAMRTAMDRCDGALAIVSAVTETSNADEPAAALALIAGIREVVEQQILAVAAVDEQLEAWISRL